MEKSELTQERLHELLHYNLRAGTFRWRVRKRSNQRAGDIAGFRTRSDYWRIRVDGRYYRAHQLAWLYMTGEWGRPLVDHRDGNPLNNRWGNLRVASHTNNAANRRRLQGKASGFKGVSFDRRSGKWFAQIAKDGRRYWLGYFKTPQEAHRAYATAARLLFGKFARME
jgi:hypothetical protein